MHTAPGRIGNPQSKRIQLLIPFVITAADNPGVLTANVRGTIFFDTIKLFFNPGTDISNLTPTIGIAGMSITPQPARRGKFRHSVHYNAPLGDDNGAILNYWVVYLLPIMFNETASCADDFVLGHRLVGLRQKRPE